MGKKKIFDSLIFKLVLGIILGIIVGNISNESIIVVINTIKAVLGQLIFYAVPIMIKRQAGLLGIRRS